MMQVNNYAETDFNQTELGPLPTDWRVEQLGDVADYVNGAAFKPTQWSQNGLPIVRIQNLTETSSEFNFFDGEQKDKYRIADGDLLISWSASLGVFLWNGGDAWLNQHIFKVVNISSEIEKIFLYFAVQYHINLLREKMHGSTMKHVVREAFLSTPIPLPPLPEQRRIVAVVNTVKAEIDAQEDIIAETQEFKRSLMQRLFTYGANLKPAETIDTPFGEIPSHWKCVPLDECSIIQTGTAKGRRFEKGEKVISVPYLRVANVQDGFLDLSEIKFIEIRAKELDRYRLQVGDVLMTEGGDFDKLGRGFVWNGEVENCIHQNHVFAVRVDQGLLSPKFLAYLGQSSYGKAYFLSVAHRTTNLASINTTKLKGLPVLVAHKHEQEEIVEMLQAVDNKIAVEEDRRMALDDFFKTMLHQLMTGQIRLLSDDGLPL